MTARCPLQRSTDEARPLHVCLISDTYPPYPHGGVGSRVVDLAEGLVAAGHQVTVAGVYPGNRGIVEDRDEILDGVRVVRLRPAPRWMRWRPGMLWDRWRLASWLRKAHRADPFDLIEYTDGYGWSLFRVSQDLAVNVRIEGTKILYDMIMERKGDQFIHWMERSALEHTDFLCSLSHYAAQETLRVSGVRRDCEVIYNAVDTALFGPASEVSREEGLIVFVNGIEPRKGVRELLLAMNAVLERHPHARLLLIGADNEPPTNGVPYHRTLMESVRPEFRDRIEFAGRVDRRTGVVPAIQRAHVCCYPSYIETFGVAPLEAMAVGKPVVYSLTGPGPELIEDGRSGLLCDPRDPQNIAEKIDAILSDEALAARLGGEAERRVKRLFDRSGWIARNIEYYRRCLAQFRPAKP